MTITSKNRAPWRNGFPCIDRVSSNGRHEQIVRELLGGIKGGNRTASHHTRLLDDSRQTIRTQYVKYLRALYPAERSRSRPPDNRQMPSCKFLCDKGKDVLATGIPFLDHARITPIINQNLIASDSIRFLLSAELKWVYSFVVLGLT